MIPASLRCILIVLILARLSISSLAAPVLEVLGRDYNFPHAVPDLPTKLSDFSDLEINTFTTDDGVQLAYWEAGSGRPLVFLPGWSANGAQYVNLLYLLRQYYHVFVLDPRNQGLSEKVEKGARVSRLAADVRAFALHEGLQDADYCGWSMGAAVLWSYIDLYGTTGVRKVIFIDEPPSIYAHEDWSESERLAAGGITTSAERLVDAFTKGRPTHRLIVDPSALERYMARDSLAFVNSEAFSSEFIVNNPNAMAQVLFDHATNDWRDVLKHKINVPTAIFTGENSNYVASQKWIHETIPHSRLWIYSDADQGDHFLIFKNPKKFAADLQSFLDETTLSADQDRLDQQSSALPRPR